MTPEQAECAALWLDRHGPSEKTDLDSALATLAAAAHLRAYAAAKRERVAVWSFDGVTGTLTAADPGTKEPRRLADVPEFAWHVPALLDCVGHPHRVTWWGESANRKAMNTQRYRLVKRLEDHSLVALAAAVQAIVLEQVGAEVFGRYEPQGLPLRVDW